MKAGPLSPAAAYLAIYPALAELGREHGYALTVHGTMGRDFDLVAIPWVERAAPGLVLVEALAALLNANWLRGPDGDPERKPHGRLAWTLMLESGCSVDLSVMPLAPGLEGETP